MDKSMLAGLESLPEAYQQRMASMMEQVQICDSFGLHGLPAAREVQPIKVLENVVFDEHSREVDCSDKSVIDHEDHDSPFAFFDSSCCSSALCYPVLP
ncbi:hypothetical protein HN51_004904 [Arachis hypogaea]